MSGVRASRCELHPISAASTVAIAAKPKCRRMVDEPVGSFVTPEFYGHGRCGTNSVRSRGRGRRWDVHGPRGVERNHRRAAGRKDLVDAAGVSSRGDRGGWGGGALGAGRVVVEPSRGSVAAAFLKPA